MPGKNAQQWNLNLRVRGIVAAHGLPDGIVNGIGRFIYPSAIWGLLDVVLHIFIQLFTPNRCQGRVKPHGRGFKCLNAGGVLRWPGWNYTPAAGFLPCIALNSAVWRS